MMSGCKVSRSRRVERSVGDADPCDTGERNYSDALNECKQVLRDQ